VSENVEIFCIGGILESVYSRMECGISKSWLQVQPEGYNPDAFLWITLSGKENLLELLDYAAIRMKLQRIAMKAGINKRIHPHLFR
jgi:site-specific recombinase XerC